MTEMIDVRVHFNIMGEIESVGEEIYMVSLFLSYTPLIMVRVTSLGLVWIQVKVMQKA